MKVTCQCGGVLRRPVPPKCPHCGALLVGARRNVLQSVISWTIAAALVAGLIVVLFVLVKYFANPGVTPKTPKDRPFERNL